MLRIPTYRSAFTPSQKACSPVEYQVNHICLSRKEIGTIVLPSLLLGRHFGEVIICERKALITAEALEIERYHYIHAVTSQACNFTIN